VSKRRISIRICSPWESFVVVDNILPVDRTGDVSHIRYSGQCVVRVPETQIAVMSVGGVGYVKMES
jgi:hypothetical protein